MLFPGSLSPGGAWNEQKSNTVWSAAYSRWPDPDQGPFPPYFCLACKTNSQYPPISTYNTVSMELEIQLGVLPPSKVNLRCMLQDNPTCSARPHLAQDEPAPPLSPCGRQPRDG
jgi:hypothetical protein